MVKTCELERPPRITTAMKFPAVFALAKASVDVVVVPASFPTCWTSVMPAACACANAPASSRSGKSTKRRVRRTPTAEEFMRRKLIDIGHPPRIKKRFSLTGLLVSFSGKGHAPPLVIAKPLLREASVRLEISRPHTTQGGWPEPRRMLGPQAALPTSKHTMLFHRY